MNNKEVKSYMDKIRPEEIGFNQLDDLTKTRMRINAHAKSIMFMYKSYASNNPTNDPWHNRIERQVLRDCLQSMHYHKLINDYNLNEYYIIDRCGNKIEIDKCI